MIEIMSLFPLWYILGLLFVLGTIIGSFLGVVSYRLHTNRSNTGSSHCESCGHDLRWYELVPVISYLCLRGRCQVCRAHIPSQHIVWEIVTGTLFALLGLWFWTDPVMLGFHLVLGSILIVGVRYDLAHLIIPREVIYGTLILATGIVLWQSIDTNIWTHAWRALIAGLLASGFFYALWRVSEGRWIGLGDAKLAFPLGVIVGIDLVFSFVVYSFWIGALVSIGLLLWNHMYMRGQRYLPFVSPKLTMKSEIPFAPFLVMSFYVIVGTGVDVLNLFTHAFEWFTY